MKILLINATWPVYSSKEYNINVYTPEISTVWTPLGLTYIAAMLLKDSHFVKIYDRNVKFAISKDIMSVDKELEKEIEDFKPELVGISATTPLVKDAFYTAKLVKDISPETTVILGGVHGTALAKEALQTCQSLDIVIRGEGEITIQEICRGIPIYKIKGISYRNEEEIISNENRKVHNNLDDFPYPARHLLNMDYYLRPSTQIIFGYKCRATSIISSRGCPNACRFCAGPIMSQNSVRYHSVEYTINEIKQLIKNYSVEGLFFVDEMFTGNRERVETLCQRMIQEKLNEKIVWGAQLRVDYIDYELLLLMKKAGCVQVEYGFESGSQKILDSMNKNITPEICIEASRITKKANIRQLINIIVGWPTETKDDLQRTIELVRKCRPDFVSWHEFKPLPGTYGWKFAKKMGIEQYSFEENKPFLFCGVSDEEKEEMRQMYYLEMQKWDLNNADSLYVER